MNRLLAMLFILLLSMQAIAEDKKLYSQKEFDKKVREEVLSQIEKIKKKSLSQLTKELIEKQQKLLDRDDALNKKAELIALNEKSLLDKILKLEQDQKKVLGCISSNKKNEVRRITQMVEVISNMKPVKAADVLSVQDSTISVKILEKIDPKKASKIFNLMDKEVSARLQKQYLSMKK